MLGRRLSQDPGFDDLGETPKPAVDSKSFQNRSQFYEETPSSRSSQWGVIGGNRSQTTQSAPCNQYQSFWRQDDRSEYLSENRSFTPILTSQRDDSPPSNFQQHPVSQKNIANHGDALLDLWYHHKKPDFDDNQDDKFSTNVENCTFTNFVNDKKTDKNSFPKESSPSLNSPDKLENSLFPETDDGPDFSNFKCYQLSELCRDYLRGSCKRKKCRFQHPPQEEFNTSLVKCDDQTRKILHLGPSKKDLPTGAMNAGLNDDPNQVPCCDLNVQTSFDENGLIPLCYLRIWLKACALSQNKKDKHEKNTGNVNFYGLSQAPLGPPQVLKHTAHKDPLDECAMIPLSDFKELEDKHNNALNRITDLESQVKRLTDAFTSAIELKTCLTSLTKVAEQDLPTLEKSNRFRQNPNSEIDKPINQAVCSKPNFNYLATDINAQRPVNFQMAYPIVEPIPPVQPMVANVPPGFQPLAQVIPPNTVQNPLQSLFASPWSQPSAFTPISTQNSQAQPPQQPQTGYLPSPGNTTHLYSNFFNINK